MQTPAEKIVMLPIDQIRPYKKNPRKNAEAPEADAGPVAAV